MKNDAPHKHSAASAAKLQSDCASKTPLEARARAAAAEFFTLWQQTLRDAASLEAAAALHRDETDDAAT